MVMFVYSYHFERVQDYFKLLLVIAQVILNELVEILFFFYLERQISVSTILRFYYRV